MPPRHPRRRDTRTCTSTHPPTSSHPRTAYLDVDDTKAYYARAKDAGAEVSKELGHRSRWNERQKGVLRHDVLAAPFGAAAG